MSITGFFQDLKLSKDRPGIGISLTEHFLTFEPEYLAIIEFCEIQKRWSPDSEALKL